MRPVNIRDKFRYKEVNLKKNEAKKEWVKLVQKTKG
jgi:hypothetical protein